MGLRKDVIDRLRQATESMTLVRIDRSLRNADRVDGFVLALGSKSVLVAQTRDGGFFDGLVAIRLKDVGEAHERVHLRSTVCSHPTGMAADGPCRD